MAKTTHLSFIGVYDRAYPREYFLQHIARMVHISFKGDEDVTLKMLADAMHEKFEDEDQQTQNAAKEFIDFQYENGTTDDTVIITGRGVFHFDLRT